MKDPNRSPLRARHRATRVPHECHTCRGAPNLQEAPRRSKTPPRRLQDAFKFSSFFGCLFGSILAPFSLPTWSPKSNKIDQKSMPRWLLMLTSFLDRFFLDFCSQLGPSEPHFGASGLAPNGFFRIFRKPHIGCDFGANLAAFSLLKSMKILPKIHPKMDQFCDRFGYGFFCRFGIDFEGQLGAMLASKIDQKLSQTPPGRPQDALRSYCFDFSAS